VSSQPPLRPRNPGCVLATRRRSAKTIPELRGAPFIPRPARFEYRLTAKGTELVDVLMVMVRWGDRWTAGEAGPPVLYRHRACGRVSHVELVCAHCAEPMHADDIDLEPGPGAVA
jgi:hypothetical protein